MLTLLRHSPFQILCQMSKLVASYVKCDVLTIYNLVVLQDTGDKTPERKAQKIRRQKVAAPEQDMS